MAEIDSTFRAEERTSSHNQARRIVVYSGGDPRRDHHSIFYLNLFWSVMTRGRELGYEMIPIIDTRPDNKRLLRPPEIKALLKDGKIDGIVGIMLYDPMVHWMEESGIPFAVMSGTIGKNCLEPDYSDIFRESFCRLSELGCGSVGLMIPSHLATSGILELMDDLAGSLNLTVNYEWILVSRRSLELNGYNQFCSLWKLRERPDGLVIFPDVTARGVVSAIVECRVRVPQDLKLVLHRNAEAPYTVPMPCDWMENSTEPMSRILLDILDRQWRGHEVPLQKVGFRLVKGGSGRNE